MSDSNVLIMPNSWDPIKHPSPVPMYGVIRVPPNGGITPLYMVRIPDPV